MTHVLVFLAAFLADVGWTMYFKEVEKDRAMRAGLWSTFIVCCGGLSVYEYAHNLIYLVDSIIGSYLGVWATMRWKIVTEWYNDTGRQL